MKNTLFGGIELVDGTKEGFDVSTLSDNNKLYLIRTDENKDEGYIRMNGKNYKYSRVIDCGEY